MGQASASASTGIDQTGDASIYVNSPGKFNWVIWVVFAVLAAVVLIKRKR